MCCTPILSFWKRGNGRTLRPKTSNSLNIKAAFIYHRDLFLMTSYASIFSMSIHYSQSSMKESSGRCTTLAFHKLRVTRSLSLCLGQCCSRAVVYVLLSNGEWSNACDLLIIQFASDATIRHLGFQSAVEARSCMYRRAKLLYDFNTVSDPIAVSQGALILTYYSSDQEPVSQCKMTWLPRLTILKAC
jgi:hypothetical protein